MATIVYPFTLTAGQPENVNQLNSNLNAITAQVNGSLDFANLSSTVQSDYNHITQSGVIISTLTNGTYGFGPGAMGTGATLPPFALTAATMDLDPADYALSARTAKYRIKVVMRVNAVAPGVTFTWGLAVPTVSYGLSGAQGTVTALTPTGTAASIASPGASAATSANSGDFTAPAAGPLVPYVAVSANMAAGSQAGCTWTLQRRTV